MLLPNMYCIFWKGNIAKNGMNEVYRAIRQEKRDKKKQKK